MTRNPTVKLILVIGATGGQGQAVVDALLAPASDGAASPYTVRALTRDLRSPQALALAARGVECVQGSFTDFGAVARALDGVYGVWVNTDGPSVGEDQEIYAGMRIFELAKRTPSLRHYVWSSLPYILKKAGFNPDYKSDQADAKGRVAEWLSVQPSVLAEDGLVWSVVTTTPYMDTLNDGTFTPLNVRKDGTVVFAAPVEDGKVPLIALKDIGWWARWTFDHRPEASGREFSVASDRVSWDQLVQTFTKVTGQPAVFRRITLDEMWANADDRVNNPWSLGKKRGDGSRTIRENISAFWRIMRDDTFELDLGWIRSVHPETYTLERWMRETRYDGKNQTTLKSRLDNSNPWGFNPEWLAQL